MEETEDDAKTTVRKTRSGKVAKTTQKGPKSAKPRRTRKKVILMEVEVSDDEEDKDVSESKDISDEEMADKTLDSPGESNDSSDHKNVIKESKKSNEDTETNKLNTELNGGGSSSEEVKELCEDSMTVVFNDIEMLETTDIDPDLQEKEIDESLKLKKETERTKPHESKEKGQGEAKKKKLEEAKELDTSKEKPSESRGKKLDEPKEKKVENKPDKTKEKGTESPKVNITEQSKVKKSEPSKEKKPDGSKEKPEELKKKQEPKMKKSEISDGTEVTQKPDKGVVTEKTGDTEGSVKKDNKAAEPKAAELKVLVEKNLELVGGTNKSVEKPEETTVVSTEQVKEKQKDAKEKVEIKERKSVGKDVTKVEEGNENLKGTKRKAEETKEPNATKKVVEKSIERLAESTDKLEKKAILEVSVEEKDAIKTDIQIEKMLIDDIAHTSTNEDNEERFKLLIDDAKIDKVIIKDSRVEKIELGEVKSTKKADAEKLTENFTTGNAISEVGKERIEVQVKSADKPKVSVDEKTDETESKKESKSENKNKIADTKQNGDPDAENISEDELPGVPVVKVPEAEEVSDEELPGPKRAELPADTEVVSEDELPNVKSDGKKENNKRKLDETDYDPGSPTSENEAPTKKPSLEAATEKDKEEKPVKPKKLPELDKYWKAVNDDPTDFTGWTYLLQYVDQENDMEAAREAYDAFLSHYPYCYGYWRKYADYEKRKGNKKKCEEVFERGLKAIPLSVDLWIHYLTYVKASRTEDEEYIRSQFERALTACGLEFRSDRLWDSYIKWETESKRLQKVTAIYDRLLATPTQGYTTHFDNFQEHVASNSPNKVLEVDEFLALRKEVRHILKHDTSAEPSAETDAPPGDEDQSKAISSDEETKSIRERIVSIRRKIHKATVNAVTARWNYEEGIKRPYFHVKPLERCQLKNWQDYLDFETEQGDRVRIVVLFERCLIACALYEEFWLRFVHYLESLKDPELQHKIRDVYERACTIHHLKKPSLHLQWAMFEESVANHNRAAEILVNLEKSVPNVLQIAYRRINLERRRSDFEKCSQLYEHYINSSKNKVISSNIAIKYSRLCHKVLKDLGRAQEILKTAISKDPNNPRLYLQLIDVTLQKENVTQAEILEIIDSFLDKESTDSEQKVLFAQRKLEYLEDFGSDVESVQLAYEQYQKCLKINKDNIKKKEAKSETAAASKKEKSVPQSTSQSSNYGNYGNYGASSGQTVYPYSGNQQGQYNYSQYGQGDQYQYQNWQYPQGGYGNYNQWSGYGSGYGY